jgi:VWFA-related protein
VQRLVAFLILASGTAASGAEEPFTIGFLNPRNGEMALGETRIELELAVPAGAAVRRVELRVDERLIATLESPPWTVTWDAGDGVGARRLEALAVLADERTARARIATSALKIDQVERVDLVDLYLTVLDSDGNHVTDLEQNEFRVFENGVRQTIEHFSASRRPLRLAIVIDSSNSMTKGDRLERARAAAIEFLDVLLPEDECLVVSFSDEVRVLGEFSAEREALAAAIRSIEPEGGTALYDAIWRTADRLREFEGRRVLVLLSDGRDEASNGLEPGSLHTLDEAVAQAITSEVIVFTIGVGQGLDRQYAIRWGQLGGASNVDTSRSLEGILRELAETTGGRAVFTASSGRIRRAFEEFAADLRHQYSIGFNSTDPARDGRWRELTVDVPGRDVTVRTRTGYYAPRAR